MKYCISYSNKSHIIDEVDEILIKYDKNKILELFTQLIPQHQTQRVIVEVGGNEVLEDEALIDQLNKIIKIHKEIPFAAGLGGTVFQPKDEGEGSGDNQDEEPDVAAMQGGVVLFHIGRLSVWNGEGANAEWGVSAGGSGRPRRCAGR